MVAAELALWTRIQMQLMELQTQAEAAVEAVQLRMQVVLRMEVMAVQE